MTGRRPGRPRLDPADPSVEMCLTLPSRVYDALYQRASVARVTVPEYVRRQLEAGADRRSGAGLSRLRR